MTDPTKLCIKCGKLKLRDKEFNRDSTRPDGHHPYCKTCIRRPKPPRGDRGADEWRPVMDFDGIFAELYEVSDLGRVWAAPRQRTPGGIVKPVRRGPYYGLNLCSGPVQVYCRVHVLVATAFLGPCRPGIEVRHGPAGSLVNCVTNLSYGTRSDNMNDRLRDGTDSRGENSAKAVLTWAIARECRERVRLGERQSALAREFGVSPMTISDLIRGVTWKE